MRLGSCRFADALNAVSFNLDGRSRCAYVVPNRGAVGPRRTRGSAPSPSHTGSQCTEPNQLPVLLVPQTKRRRLQTRGQCNWLYLREEFIRIVTLLQVVVGNEGAQMVDMMKPDIAREPLQDSR